MQVCKTGKKGKTGRSEDLPHAATIKRDHRHADMTMSLKVRSTQFSPGLQARSLKPQRRVETSSLARTLQQIEGVASIFGKWTTEKRENLKFFRANGLFWPAISLLH